MDSHVVSLITAGAAAIVALGTLASLPKKWSAAWRRANTLTSEWPVCSACRGHGNRGRAEPQCCACSGAGRTRPGFFSRFRKTLGGFAF
jgi:hypothetical protein